MSFRTLKLELQSFVPQMNDIEAGIRLNRSYQHLVDARSWSFLRVEGLLQTTAPYSTGTIQVTQGSAAITGNGTAWTTPMIGRFIRVRDANAYYCVTDIDTLAQTATLQATYGEADDLTAPYTMFDNQLSVPVNLAHIDSVRYDIAMPEQPVGWFDWFDPTRIGTGTPVYWTNVGNGIIEIYPLPDAVYTLRVRGKLAVSDMAAQDDVSVLPERLVLAHARMSAYLQLASDAERGAAYLQLYQVAQADFSQLWQVAEEEDLHKLSLPRVVADVDDELSLFSDDFMLSHDIMWRG